jgi:hypothetical protein
MLGGFNVIRNPEMFVFHARHVMDIARVVRRSRRDGIAVRTYWANWVRNSAYTPARARPPSKDGSAGLGCVSVSSLYYATILVQMSQFITPKEPADVDIPRS